jgi:hypothetical protein
LSLSGSGFWPVVVPLGDSVPRCGFVCVGTQLLADVACAEAGPEPATSKARINSVDVWLIHTNEASDPKFPDYLVQFLR